MATYRVDPGPPLKLTAVDVRVDGPGATDPGFRERVLSFPLHEGDVLYHPGYDVGKQTLVDYAAAGGYLDAAYTVNEIRVDQAAYTAAIVLHFSTGPAYLFGPVTFEQDFLDPDILRGYVTFKEGERLNVDKLLEMQAALSDSPYFQRVEVLPRQDQAENLRVPIEVELLASKRQRWHAGLGYGTDTGPRGTVALELRRINRHGHRGQSEIKHLADREELRRRLSDPRPLSAHRRHHLRRGLRRPPAAGERADPEREDRRRPEPDARPLAGGALAGLPARRLHDRSRRGHREALPAAGELDHGAGRRPDLHHPRPARADRPPRRRRCGALERLVRAGAGAGDADPQLREPLPLHLQGTGGADGDGRFPRAAAHRPLLRRRRPERARLRATTSSASTTRRAT